MIASIARAFHATDRRRRAFLRGRSDVAEHFLSADSVQFLPAGQSGSGHNPERTGVCDIRHHTSLARVNFINDARLRRHGLEHETRFQPVINAGTPDQMVAWLDTLFLHSTTPDADETDHSHRRGAVDPTDTRARRRQRFICTLPLHVPGAALNQRSER